MDNLERDKALARLKMAFGDCSRIKNSDMRILVSLVENLISNGVTVDPGTGEGDGEATPEPVIVDLENMPSGFSWRVGQDPGYIDETNHFHLAYLTIGQLRLLVEKNGDVNGVSEKVDSIEIETSEREGHKHTLTVQLFGSELIVTNVTSTSDHDHKAYPLSNADLSAFSTIVDLDQAVNDSISNQKLTQKVISISEDDLDGYEGTLEENIAAHVSSLGISKQALEDVSIEYSYEDKQDLVMMIGTINIPGNQIYAGEQRVYSAYPYKDWFYDSAKTLKANDINSQFGEQMRASLQSVITVEVTPGNNNYFGNNIASQFTLQSNGEYVLSISSLVSIF